MIHESLIYRLITGIFALFKRLGQDSVILKGLRRFGALLGTLFSNSAIVCFATGRELLIVLMRAFPVQNV